MDWGDLHIAAAIAALVVGPVVLAGRKGGTLHVALGRVFVTLLLLTNVPVLFLYEATGWPGPFHVLAVISLVTTGLGWLSVRRASRGPRSGARIEAHAALMTWSWIGVATAGLAQLANRQLPEQSPWPVLVVVGLASAVGLTLVPRYVTSQLPPRGASRDAAAVPSRPARRGAPPRETDVRFCR